MPNTRQTRINPIAFYLPQFHQIPENDQWWGEGFTEWTNVRKATPLFRGHEQPKTPTAFGYYDLTNPEVRSRQASLAQSYGIEAFCYWHYWFGSGRRILERPFAEVLESGEPQLPFCLCWANQSWTGVWHGAPGKVLVEQTYPGEADYRAHFDIVREAFEDPRYLRVDGMPVFLVYEPEGLPNASDFVTLWRGLAVEAGMPGIFLIGMGSDASHSAFDSFDGVMLNAPGDYLEQRKLSFPQRAVRRLAASKVGAILPGSVRAWLGAPRVFDYKDVVERAFAKLPQGERFVPCVIPGWDNTPRSGRRGVVMRNAGEDLFYSYLTKAAARVADNRDGRRLVFIKAWNEWAEGNYLEPDLAGGLRNLGAVRRVL